MKYHMRRNEKEITNKKEIHEILKGGKYAIISLARDNEAYIITLSYVYDQEKHALYFHCAKEGQKIDFIKFNSSVCGTIIEDNGYKEGCIQAFRSLVFRGKIVIVDNLQEKKYAFDVLLNHLEKNKNKMKDKHFNNDGAYDKPAILRLDIKEITGKEEKAES
ncbi:hypothetical protein LCGC14_0628360 [marine sediment metagenome]|uniref:Pyridoxamine 5'-phosphate oxidase putative domain-containing protein n=1 Tax=marine sediment metagenome TaxID=412755 RepID=A0A0F9RM70_9ZZZZ